MVRWMMLSSRRLLIPEVSPSGNEVSLPSIVKTTGKQPNPGSQTCCSIKLIKMKPKNVKRNWAVQLLGRECRPKTQGQNRV